MQFLMVDLEGDFPLKIVWVGVHVITFGCLGGKTMPTCRNPPIFL